MTEALWPIAAWSVRFSYFRRIGRKSLEFNESSGGACDFASCGLLGFLAELFEAGEGFLGGSGGGGRGGGWGGGLVCGDCWGGGGRVDAEGAALAGLVEDGGAVFGDEDSAEEGGVFADGGVWGDFDGEGDFGLVFGELDGGGFGAVWEADEFGGGLACEFALVVDFGDDGGGAALFGGGEVDAHAEVGICDAEGGECGGDEDGALRGVGFGEDADLPIGGGGIGGCVEFVEGFGLVAGDVDGGGSADAGWVPEEAGDDFFGVSGAASDADFEVDGAVFDDGDGRGFEVDAEGCLVDDGGGDAVEGDAVVWAFVVDVDVVDGVGEAAGEGWGIAGGLDGEGVEGAADGGIGCGFEDDWEVIDGAGDGRGVECDAGRE